MEEQAVVPNGAKAPTLKRKSIFTDVVHLAGLTDSNKSGGRESVLDLRTKPSFQHQEQQPLPSSHGPSALDPSLAGGFSRKSPSGPLVLDRSHSFSAFASPPFFPSETYPQFLTPPRTFHDFLPAAVLGVQSGVSEGVPLCWSSAYSHAASAFLSPLSFRPQFPPAPYNLNMPVDSGMNGGGRLGHGQGQPLVVSGGGSVKLQAVAAVARVKQAPRFQCPDCSRVYSTFSGLSKHRQFHCAAQLKRQFGCKFCQKHYTSLGALKMHIRTHTLPCKCELCGKAFSRPWLLQGHVRTHTGEKPFRCLHCGRAFADRSNLRAHLQTHSDVKKYRCACCQKTFSRMSLLTKHESNGCPALWKCCISPNARTLNVCSDASVA